MKQTANYYTSTRLEIVTFVPESTNTILDIGCGSGAFLQAVKEKIGAETWGIELVPEIAEKAKIQVDKILTGNVEDVLKIIPDGYFDCITFNDVLEHLLEPTEILRLVKPKLSDKGIIIASIPNVRYFFNLYKLLIKKDWEYKDSGILDSTHLRFFTQKSMKRIFEQAGYNLINQVGINKTKSWKFQIINFLFIGFLTDTKYLQYVCITEPLKY